jgi:hypothetical protein
MSRRERLAVLTDRWRRRHDDRKGGQRPPADPDREALAARAFPFQSQSPAAYVAEHGADMLGFTYDDERYTDPQLDAWLVEVGRMLRARR